jgi:hypothetical protein
MREKYDDKEAHSKFAVADRQYDEYEIDVFRALIVALLPQWNFLHKPSY